jgi:hypothetical protein
MLCALCIKKGHKCIMDPGYRVCWGCTNSHLGCSLVPTAPTLKPIKVGGSKVTERGERTGDKMKKAAPASKDTRATRAKAMQLEIRTSYERGLGKGGGEASAADPMGDFEGPEGEAGGRGGVEWGAR